MKQYDKVFVPDEYGQFEAVDYEDGHPEKGTLSKKNDVIVLTIEELIAMWNAGCQRMEEIMNNISQGEPEKETKIPNLKIYLQSKGINI